MDGSRGTKYYRCATPLPHFPEKFLIKFDPDKPTTAKYHINNFYLLLRLLDVKYKDVNFRIFPYTFENKVATWYHGLLEKSITN